MKNGIDIQLLRYSYLSSQTKAVIPNFLDSRLTNGFDLIFYLAKLFIDGEL